MRITRLFVLLGLAALLAPHAEASRTSVWERNPPASLTVTRAEAAGLLASLAPAARFDASAQPGVEPAEPPLFNLGDVAFVESALEHEVRFDLGPLTLVDLNLLRGPPPSYPETRARGFELLPPFHVGASPRLSLWPRQACGFVCGEVVSDSRYDPWGLKVTVKAEIPGAPVNPLPSVDLETGRHPFLDEALLGPLSSAENAGRKVINTLANAIWAIGHGLERLDEKGWEKGIACRGCTTFGIDMATLLSGTREAQAAFEVLGDFGRALSARRPPPRGVQANKAAGDAARDAIAEREAPALTERNMSTLGGTRRIDVLAIEDDLTILKINARRVGIESKVGETSLTPRVRQELARDWWLRRQGQLDDVIWEFTPSEVTGKGGPTKELQDMLNKLGFDTRINAGAP